MSVTRLGSIGIVSLVIFSFFIWFFWQSSPDQDTLSVALQTFDKAGEETKKDLSRIPSLPVTEEMDSFIMQDDNQTGVSITYANRDTENQLASTADQAKDRLSLSFPKDQTKPLEIKLDQERIITIQDTKNQGLTFKTITNAPSLPEKNGGMTWYQKLLKALNSQDIPATFLAATNQRKTLLYTFQKDHATNEKQLKSWTLYEKGNGIEEEAYRFTNAKIKINDDGNAEVFYFGEKDIQNQQTQADVEPSLLERAQRVISEDMGTDILNSNKHPDFLIPKPFFYDKNGDIHETDWQYDKETNTLALQISVKHDLYPLALDPTLSFTAPAQSNTGWVVTGEASSDDFGESVTSGDFNADGKTDLAVGAYGYSTNTGRTYIFYNDGSIPTTAATADVIITGETTSNSFGASLTSGDFNADGKTDLAVGATLASKVYLFYNDGNIPITAASADVIIGGTGSPGIFGDAMTTGDFNSDGRFDLAVGASAHSGVAGSAYIFYNDGSYPATASVADISITSEDTDNEFGVALVAGDFNADGKVDLAVGASQYSTNTGRTYIFYNDGSIPTTAATADVIITGETTNNYFGGSLTSGDFNADGKTDLAVGAGGYSAQTGRVYLFYNDGSIPTTAASADVIITGAGYNFGGWTLAAGDWNADGKTDLATCTLGSAYIFYNDGSIPTTAATADVIITTETLYNYYGFSLLSGDFNADGKTDLIVGTPDYASRRGRVYIFTSQNGQVNTNVNLTGETTNNNFGVSLTSGDFNSDGKIDLAVGADGYSSSTGRTYLFYNDGSIPTTAATADVIITGEATSNSFGASLTPGDFNADGKIDLAVGASQYSTNTGRTYIFYNDGSIPTAAASADVIITGEATNNFFGGALTSGDFNTDGKTDLAVGAYGYSSNTGRAYIFYNDGSIPTTAATADVIITGETTNNYFGYPLTSGDLNADGKIDLVVGAMRYSTFTGRAYLFYNDGSIPTTAATADVTITGEATNNNFGYSLTFGDFNADGKTDLAIGATGYSTSTGRAYLFYNDGSIPTTAATADVIITGEVTGSSFGIFLTPGDFNADGKVDLAVGAYGYSSNTGRVYLFYNDGSIPTTAATADVIITGETTNNNFGYSLTSGDFNADGKTDLVVGASGYSTSTGRVYLYETRDNFAWQLQSQSSLSGGLRTNPSFSGQEFKITGEVGTGKFGNAMIAGDFNADGKVDLAVGAYGYSSNTGRVYLFYNDGSIPTTAATADVIITGETTNNNFGYSLTSGDFNADGKTDLAVGAILAAIKGRAYVFWNDGSFPTTAVAADAVITGPSSNSTFGAAFASGDFNADGKADLVVSASQGYDASPIGMAYIFYNGSIVTETTAGADITITGNAVGDRFGGSLISGDFNSDGNIDLAVGAWGYSSNTGRVYVFHNDGSIPTTAATADVTITGAGGYFGYSLAVGDMNTDGKTDLIAGAIHYNSYVGRAYIFHNDGSIPTTAATADVIISGQNYVSFSSSLAVGDFNVDGRADLAVGGYDEYGSMAGKVYIFYNDGSIPTTAATADVIMIGEAASSSGISLASGDFNADGKTDLAVGASKYSSSRGRVYMYTFNDGVITGETTSNYFGYSLTSGDFNADGKIDLAVGAFGHSSSTGRTYLFYNDGSIPTTAATADVIITGETTSNNFGWSLTSGDFNADGKTDLAVGAYGYSTNTGRAYLFYNDGSIPTTAATADVIITGETTSNYFGYSLTSGDFNADGKTDLAVGAHRYSGLVGRVYLFYNDGSIPTTAATADVIITGETTNNYFGTSLTSGDFNADGKTDLAVGAYQYSSSTGRAYLFYNDGSIPTTAATADVIITGETTNNYFGYSLTSGDFNADGKTDLAVGAYAYSSSTGRVYLFYNDGSIPTTAATADVIITGGATGHYFGYSLTSGDFNADGKTDLTIGAYGYSFSTGRTYLFYNDGSIPTTAATADVIITGETTNNYFGTSLTSGDFNADGKTDLVVGAYAYSSFTGRVYIFTTEAKAETERQRLLSKGTFRIRGSFLIK